MNITDKMRLDYLEKSPKGIFPSKKYIGHGEYSSWLWGIGDHPKEDQDHSTLRQAIDAAIRAEAKGRKKG